MDEIVYTLDHLNGFVKKKFEVWSAFTQQIAHTNKIIVADALLNKYTIDFFKNMGKTIWIVENEFKSFSNTTSEIIEIQNSFFFIKDVYDQLSIGKKIVCPVNSKTIGTKLKAYK